MNQVSKISSTAGKPLARRLPLAYAGLDVNFCRNPLCAIFGIPPDPFKRPRAAPPAPPSTIRGVVTGARHEEPLKCPTCGRTSRLKNNKAIAEEYQRPKRLHKHDPAAASCRNDSCAARGMAAESHPDLDRRFGKTAKGDPRWQCRLCSKTFSVGKPARRHRRSDKNRLIFQMLCNDTSLSKIGKIADISYRDLYGKIDYFHDRVRAFTAERQDFSKVDFREMESRFATDSQTLIINWPTKRERTSIAVQHLCTAHTRSGFIMEAALQFDPSMTMDEAEREVVEAHEDHLSAAFREHARIWAKTEFEACLTNPQKQVKETDLHQLPIRVLSSATTSFNTRTQCGSARWSRRPIARFFW